MIGVMHIDGVRGSIYHQDCKTDDGGGIEQQQSLSITLSRVDISHLPAANHTDQPLTHVLQGHDDPEALFFFFLTSL